MREFLVISLLTFFSFSNSTGQTISPDPYYFLSDSKLEIRWNYPDVKNVDYFTVEKNVLNVWVKISDNISPLKSYQESMDLLGIKFIPFQEIIQAYSINYNRSIERLWSKVVDSLDDLKFLNLLASNNIEYAKIMACYFKDDSCKINDRLRVFYWQDGIKKLWTELIISENGRLDPISNLNADVGRSGAELSWKALSDRNKYVTGYRLYRRLQGEDLFKLQDPYGQIALGSLALKNAGYGEKESYLERYLQIGKTYEYYLVSTNAFGLESSIGKIIEVRVGGESLEEPFNFSAKQLARAVSLSWENIEGNSTFIYRSDESSGEFELVFPLAEPLFDKDTSWLDHDIELGRTYYYFARSSDTESNLSPTTDTLEIILNDNEAPSAPRGVRLEPIKGVMQISWETNPESDILGYEIERYADVNFSIPILLNSEPQTEIQFNDTLLEKSEVLFGYVIYALDQSYNKSEGSEIAKAQLPDLNPPGSPYIIDADYISDSISLRWIAPMDTDVTSYSIYIKKQGSTTEEKMAETAKLDWKGIIKKEGAHDFWVKAEDEAGNLSEASNTIQYDLKINREIGVPSGGSVELVDEEIFLKWVKPRTGIFNGFTIYRKNLDNEVLILIDEFDINVNQYIDKRASKSTNYKYLIHCHDDDYDTGKALELNYKSQ